MASIRAAVSRAANVALGVRRLLRVGRKFRRAASASIPIVMVGSLLYSGGPASAQQQDKEQKPYIFGPTDLVNACPKGYRAEFRYGSTSLFVDLSWLETYSLLDTIKVAGPRCPQQSILEVPLYFRKTILDLANTPDDLGRPFLFFFIKTASDTRMKQANFWRTIRARQPKPGNEPTIADITSEVYSDARPSPTSRVYLLQYPGNSEGTDPSVIISCGGPENLGRDCFVPVYYRYHQDLDVGYHFSQRQLRLADAATTASQSGMQEPEAVLKFDMRIRAWIDSLMQRP